MHITKDPDTGVVDQVCTPLDPEKVCEELMFCLRQGRYFLGKPDTFWREIITQHAQALADEADPEQYEWWEIRYLEANE